MVSLQAANKLNHYPSLTDEEFEEGCRALEAKCCDNLDGTNWLSVKWHDDQLEVKQMGGLESEARCDTGVETEAEEKDYGEKDVEDFDSDEDIDTVVRHHPITDGQHRPAINFSVVLSPTYRVPVLWFTLSLVKVARVSDLEEMYLHVVPATSQETLKRVGVMGGISLANHPITDIPAFFVHPCNTPEAMLALNDGSEMDPFRYLLLWLGIIGVGVGLHVPSKVAA